MNVLGLESVFEPLASQQPVPNAQKKGGGRAQAGVPNTLPLQDMNRSAELGRVGFTFAPQVPGRGTGPETDFGTKRAFITRRKREVKPSKVGSPQGVGVPGAEIWVSGVCGALRVLLGGAK
jgi:hypothetical protein